MSKVICEVCGTAYPEASEKCPICGCVRPADVQTICDDAQQDRPARKYEHVKGGRFSKENVRKRNMSNQSGAYAKPTKSTKPTNPVKPAASTQTNNKKKKKNNGNTGLVITIIVLLLAIIAVVAYIILKFFVPASTPQNVPTDPVEIVETEEPIDDAWGDILCVGIELDSYEIQLESAGDYTYIEPELDPFDTTDEVTFESADNSIAMAESDGRVTAVSKGETFITITCGNVSTQCKVLVGVVKEELALNRQEITFENEGDSWTVYSGNIDVQDIVWSSDDEAVAVVENGVVTAVGEGSTTVYGNYDGQIQSCVIRCEFVVAETEGGTEGNGNVSSDDENAPAEDEETQPTETQPTETQPAETQPSSEYAAPFSLKNLIGPNSKEVSLSVGESFKLALVDSNGTHIKGVTWTVEGSCCTVNEGTVTASRSGNCVIVATYNGETYKCKIIVW